MVGLKEMSNCAPPFIVLRIYNLKIIPSFPFSDIICPVFCISKDEKPIFNIINILTPYVILQLLYQLLEISFIWSLKKPCADARAQGINKRTLFKNEL